MTDIQEYSENAAIHIRSTLENASLDPHPYPHWSIENVLPDYICKSLLKWDPGSEAISGDIKGRREYHNQYRVFVDKQKQDEDVGCAALAQAFEAKETRDVFTRLTGASLDNTWLRLELCLDKEGFWLEPHTDIGAKKLTFLLSLSTAPGSEEWGTDIMTPDGKSLGRSLGKFNSAFLFIPSNDTWHGYQRRPMKGIRRTLILNYVDDTWRAKQELAFPPSA